MNDAACVHPAALRPPTAWLVPRVSSRATPEGFTETTTSYFEADLGAVNLAAERVISDLRRRPRAEPPKIVAGQLAAHYSLRNEPLPSLVVQAMAAAMSLNRTVARQEWPDRAVAVEAARLASADRPTRRDRAIVFDVVRWLSERSEPIPREVFQAVVTALGLTEGDRLRQWVVEWVTPAPQPEMRLAGLRVNGREFSISDRPDIDLEPADLEIVWGKRAAEPRIGLRMPALFDAVVGIEAEARLPDVDWGLGKDGKEKDAWDGMMTQTLTPADLAQRAAKALGKTASANTIPAWTNTINAWTKTQQFRMAAFARTFWKSEPKRLQLSKAKRRQQRLNEARRRRLSEANRWRSSEVKRRRLSESKNAGKPLRA